MRSLLLFDMVNNLLQCTLVSGRWSPPADIQRVESFLCSLWPQASGLRPQLHRDFCPQLPSCSGR